MPAEHQEVDAAVSEQVALATLAERWVTAKARVTLAVQRRLVDVNYVSVDLCIHMYRVWAYSEGCFSYLYSAD